jgi:uncharacterized protein YndB with AHSA1/START domain
VTADPELVITRTVAAPRALVYQAFTEGERLARWWGPAGMAVEIVRLELRPGGMFLYALTMPNGARMWGRWVFEEIVAGERLAFTSGFSDEHGGVTRHPMSATWPLEVRNTITFAADGGQTTLTMRGRAVGATAEELATFTDNHHNVQKGFAGTFAQLDGYLEGLRTLELTRLYAAPRALVYQALTHGEHLAKWFGPDGFTITNLEADIRVGGAWRFTMHAPGGMTFPNRIVYEELVPNERLVYVHDGDGNPDDPHAFRVTMTLTDEDGQTRFTVRSVFASVARVEEVKKFGAVELGAQTWRKLGEFVAR